MRTLVIKFIGCLLAVGSGLPAGPEAPMIHLGAMCGRAISAHDSLLAWLGKKIPPLEKVLILFRNERDARDFVTAGTAAGVASAFGAPVGGVLFALEELSSSWTPSLTYAELPVAFPWPSMASHGLPWPSMAFHGLPWPSMGEALSSSWTPSLTYALDGLTPLLRPPRPSKATVRVSRERRWKILLTSMTAATVPYVLISAFADLEDGGVFDGTIEREAIEFYQAETSVNNVAVIIPAMCIGVVAGAIAAGFTGANMRMIGWRKRRIAHTPWRRVAEPMVVMLVLVGLTVGLSALYGCTPVARADPLIAQHLVGLHCENGEYNELATLLYTPGGQTIKNLWSRHYVDGHGRETFGAPALLILLAVYMPLACWLAGTIVPTGLIVPVLLIGATIGRTLTGPTTSFFRYCVSE